MEEMPRLNPPEESPLVASGPQANTRSWLLRKPHLLLLFSVDAWNLYLHCRQLEFILRNSKVPAVIEKSISQSDYTTIRVGSAFSIMISMVSIYARLYTHSSSMSGGTSTELWRNTAELSHNNELRAILWATIDDILSKFIVVPLVIVLSIFNKGVKHSPLAVAVAGVAWLMASAIVTAIRTLILIKATNRYGSRFFIYLSVISETIIILGHVVFIQCFAPLLMSKLPDGPSKSNIDDVATKAG